MLASRKWVTWLICSRGPSVHPGRTPCSVRTNSMHVRPLLEASRKKGTVNIYLRNKQTNKCDSLSGVMQLSYAAEIWSLPGISIAVQSQDKKTSKRKKFKCPGISTKKSRGRTQAIGMSWPNVTAALWNLIIGGFRRRWILQYEFNIHWCCNFSSWKYLKIV